MVPIADSVLTTLGDPAEGESMDLAAASTAQRMLLGEKMAKESPGLARMLRAEMLDQIPELAVDSAGAEMLESSVRSNIETIAQVLRHVVDVENLVAPIGAREYTERLAQRGVSLILLLQAYRLGQQILIDWGFSKLDETADVDVAFSSYHAFCGLINRYVDLISEQVVAAYQREHQRWIAHRNNVAAEFLDLLLADVPVDLDKAELSLDHRLRQMHLGVLVWADAPHFGESDPVRLERIVAELNRSMRDAGGMLYWQRDRVTGWAWFGVDQGGEVPDVAGLEAALAEVDPHVRVAFGTPAAGPSGFRATHLEAHRAQQVAIAAGLRAPRVISYGDPGVRFTSLLVNDLEVARRFVSLALGGLAEDTPPAERLRTTAMVFLEAKGSHTAAAQRLHLHKNSVKYRLKRAAEERGKPVDEERLDLELALIACSWLGSAVLRAPSASEAKTE
jgi:sugar diacid utilization regulator